MIGRGSADRTRAKGARAGDGRVAFAEVFDREYPAIYRYLARRVPQAVAEDLASETFTRALEGFSSFDPERGSRRAWLFGIATNLLSRHHRDEARAYTAYARTGVDPLVHGHDAAETAVRRADASSQGAALAAALAELSPGDRDVLLLVAHADFTHVEVAQALDIPVGTVRSRLHRARRAVTHALDPQEDS